MSAFVCEDKTIFVLVNAAHIWKLSKLADNDMCKMLRDENLASVNYRYSNSTPQIFPIGLFPGLTLNISPGAIAKAATCYRYQSCEHPGWKNSDARRLIDHIMSHCLRFLPGYEEAIWE